MALPGYAGKILRVDLTNERLWTEDIDEATAREWIGSAGLGAKILYDEVPPSVQWNDPENRLIIGSGPLGGTRVVGSGTISVATKGPMTNGAVLTQANGYMAAYMKFSGYDAVVVQGQARRWLYLYLHDGQAELRDASHLLGKDTWETQDVITQELGAKDSSMSVFSVGPAGENLAFLAGVNGDKGHAAAHNGTGAVMGSKKLKAIAASRSGGKVDVADARKLSEKARELYNKTKGSDSMLAQIASIGTLFPHTMIMEMGILPVKNYQTAVFAEEGLTEFNPEFIRGEFQAKRHPCWACQSAHCHLLTIPRGPWKGIVVEEPEYEGLAAWGALTGNADVAAAVFLASEVDKLGFDTNGAGWAVSLAMECYQKGLITKADTGGLDLTWGNVEAVRELLHMMAHRQGIGDVLADGAAHAAKRIGGEAANMAIYAGKGAAPRGHDHRVMVAEMLDTSTSSTGTVEVWGWEGADELGLTPPENPLADPIATSTMNAKMNGRQQFIDSLGVCCFTSLNMGLIVDCVNAATGWQLTVDEAMTQGRRIVNLLKAFNLRHGLTADLDAPSPRYGSIPVDGVAAGVGMAQHWDAMRSNYYEQMGWERSTGKPLPETLRAVGLESVINDVWEVEPAR